MVLAQHRRTEQYRHSLICPRCGKSTIVLHGDSTYVCLDRHCGFRHDVSEKGEGSAIVGFLSILLGAGALIVLL